MNCCCSSSISRACKASFLASLPDEQSLRSPSSSPPGRAPVPPKTPSLPTPSRTRTRLDRRPPRKRTESTQSPSQQARIIQIERAIGTGVFRDNEPLDFEERRSVLDGIIPGSSRRFETAVERKLRETGEWIVTRSERSSNSSGKTVLVVMFQWLLPTWVLLLLVTSGVVKLPFDVPILNDLIM